MNERVRSKIWTGAEWCLIAGACAAIMWAFWNVHKPEEDHGVLNSRGGTPNAAAPALAPKPRKEEAPAVGSIWPRVERPERAKQDVVAKAQTRPPLELLGIVWGPGGKSTGAMVYDGRSDSTVVIETGTSLNGILVRTVGTSSVEVCVDGVDLQLALAKGGS